MFGAHGLADLLIVIREEQQQRDSLSQDYRYPLILGDVT
jgi:hypothetical protein